MSPPSGTSLTLAFPSHPTAVAAKSLQSCPTLCDPMDCSPPGSSIHGIFQARVLEWGAIAFSDSGIKINIRISLVVQWLRIHLPLQGTQVGYLVCKLRSHMPQGD